MSAFINPTVLYLLKGRSVLPVSEILYHTKFHNKGPNLGVREHFSKRDDLSTVLLILCGISFGRS